MGDPRVRVLRRHLVAAGKVLEELSNDSDRRLMLFVASGHPSLIDTNRREEVDHGRTGASGADLDEGGCVVASFEPKGIWDGGDW